jgi:hypothetical protein
MRQFLTGIVSATVLCGFSLAQNTGYPANSTPNTRQPAAQASAPAGQTGGIRIAPGSVIPVQLTKTVDAKKVKTGDQVVAKVTQDLKNQSGQIIVPKNTEVLGHITEAQARSKQEKESELGIAFDRAVTKDGGNVNLPMSIQAVIGPQNPGNSPGQSAAPPSGGGMPSGGERPGTPMGGTSNGAPPNAPTGENGPGTVPQGNAQIPPITAKTQGVIGISNLKLESSGNAQQGSLLISEKKNVKLEGGTMMLLRVNQ